jgi:hypothetical protein
MTQDKYIGVLEQVCNLLSAGKQDDAQGMLIGQYPHQHTVLDKRKWTDKQKLKLYKEDGFIDRYTGQRLLFPGVLHILTAVLGDAFPFHPRWKMTKCHVAYWHYIPTCDHEIPIARGKENGGVDTADNIVTSSQSTNSAKSNFTLEELGWTLREPGKLSDWDGMMSWFETYVAENPDVLTDKYVNRWAKTLKSVGGAKANG